MNTDLLQEIVERLERLEKLMIAATPPSRRPARLCAIITENHTPDAILEARVDEFVRLFRITAGLHRAKKMSQSFPKAIVQPPGKEAWPIVPVSIMVNRAQMRRLFRTQSNEQTTSVENVHEAMALAVKRGLLVISAVNELFPQQSSTVQIVVAPEAVEPAKEAGWQRDESAPEKRRVGRPTKPREDVDDDSDGEVVVGRKLEWDKPKVPSGHVWPEDQHNGETLSAENAPELAPDPWGTDEDDDGEEVPAPVSNAGIWQRD